MQRYSAPIICGSLLRSSFAELLVSYPCLGISNHCRCLSSPNFSCASLSASSPLHFIAPLLYSAAALRTSNPQRSSALRFFALAFDSVSFPWQSNSYPSLCTSVHCFSYASRFCAIALLSMRFLGLPVLFRSNSRYIIALPLRSNSSQ